MNLHTYKVCQLLARDPEQRVGRPPREVLMAWDDLRDDEVILIRKVQEPRLRANQIAELDGKIVARGLEPVGAAAVAPAVEEDGEDQHDDADGESDGDEAEDLDQADDVDDTTSRTDQIRLSQHASRMVWDAYRQHAAASAQLREQTNELNRRAIDQAKQLSEALAAMQSRQPSPPINVSVDELMDLLRVGMGMVREYRKHGSDEDPEQE